ncbi:MAG TPA: SDR family oxidoreductase [Verrucomicrobiae bacterium]|nr:SDR family oxidoreductase [Verrucomicrobiae bacterium]
MRRDQTKKRKRADSAKRIIITGACGDIGRALAFEWARRGASLALCDLATTASAKRLTTELRSLGSRVIYRRADVTQANEVEKFVREAAEALGGLDICIANAGIVERGALIDLSAESWRRTMEVNLTGCFLTAQAAAKQMVAARNGHILFMSSWVQDVARENIGAYCASKGGVKMLAKTLALELGPLGIRVNLAAPGFVDAGLTGQNLRARPERRPRVEAEIPFGRLISAEDLARTVVLLCSDEASYITGATWLVDGGSSLFYRKA